MKREGKNPFIPLHRDRSPSRSRRPINAPRSDKSPSQTCGDNNFYGPIIFIGLAQALSPDLKDLGPKSRVCNGHHGTDLELADGQSSSPKRSARAIENVM